jgi:mono/diheme cytochrome c family protein
VNASAAGFLLSLAALALPLHAAETKPARHSTPDDALVRHGRFVFEKNCVPCHGARGDGTGELGTNSIPRPRDFTTGVFKFRSTPSGALPVDDDLAATIRRGLTGTAMPSFAALPERDIRAAVAYLKTFSPRWNDARNHAPPVPLPKLPAWFSDEDEMAARMNKGRALFEITCAPCHGMDGAGGGATSTNLTDSWSQPLSPSNLRLSQLRCGGELPDIYRVLVTGLNGTPMPSFADGTTEEQRWELVAYIEKLRREHRRQSGK